MKIDWLAGFLCAFLLASCATAVPGPEPADSINYEQPKAPVAISLNAYFHGLRTVELIIDEAAYTFLLDTAAGRTLLSPQLAAKTACKPSGRDVGYRMNGEPVVFRNCERLQATLSGYPIQLAPVAVFDVNALLPPELPRLDGVLALDSFRGQVITLDWPGNELIIHPAENAVAAWASQKLPLRFATGENGAALSVLLPVQATGTPLWFLLDSGNIRGTLVSRELVQERLIEVAPDASAQLAIGTSPVESLAVVADDINYDGVLGADFLQTRTITLDLRNAP